jgi:hypothetical protein
MKAATENFAASGLDDAAPLDRWPGIVALALLLAFVLWLPARVTAPPPAEPISTVTESPAATDHAGQRPALAQPTSTGTTRLAHRSVRRVGRWNTPLSVKTLADRVLASADNEGRDFVIVDKRHARIFAVGADGRLLGHAPVLLGAARGDDSVPGIGERPIALIRPFERTTPAGRFVAAAGLNARGEDIVWVDYDAAISMHRVRAVNPRERRLQRLASPSAADNRISYGCINMPAAFFDTVISPLFRGGERAVYVLPETRPLQQVFAFVGTPVAPGRHEQQVAHH